YGLIVNYNLWFRVSSCYCTNSNYSIYRVSQLCSNKFLRKIKTLCSRDSVVGNLIYYFCVFGAGLRMARGIMEMAKEMDILASARIANHTIALKPYYRAV